MTPRYFATAAAFRTWLARHHAARTELWVGYYKKASGRRGVTYDEAVEQALCFGWIDGVVRRVDAERHCQRFTPRRPRSTWSAVNVRRFEALKVRGLVAPAGQAAFDAWDGNTAAYSYERRAIALAPALQDAFERHPRAWRWFSESPPGYRRQAIAWVMTAAREETRTRRLHMLIADSARGERIAPLRPAPRPAAAARSTAKKR